MNISAITLSTPYQNPNMNKEMATTRSTNQSVSNQKSNEADLIEKLQEQIQKVRENEYYDTDTKKSKIKELEKQIEEIQEMKKAKEVEALKAELKKSNQSNKNSNETTNLDGDTATISSDAMSLIEAGISLDNLKNISSSKTKLQGEGNVLASEIEIDKGRGVNTSKKEEQLSEIDAHIRNTEASLGEAIKEANEASSNKKDSITANDLETEESDRSSAEKNIVTENKNSEPVEIGIDAVSKPTSTK